MIYLDHAATSWPKPPEVLTAMRACFDMAGGNPGRSGHRSALEAHHVVMTARRKVARLLHGVEPDRVVFTLNGTDALNIAIKGAVRPGQHVVFTAADHNSVRRPVFSLAQQGTITMTCVGVSAAGVVDPDDIRRALNSKTRLIVLPHASNVTGVIQPVREVVAAAREADALVLLDAAQTAGVLDLDVPRLGVDLIAFPGHKALRGPTGTGVLYVGPRAVLQPLREGGTGAESESPAQPEALPMHLEAGTPNVVGLAGLSAALDVVKPSEALEHERALMARLLSLLADMKTVRIHGTKDPAKGVGVVSVSIDDLDPQDASAMLDTSFDIAVRAGLHCAPLIHRAMGTHPAGTLRASFGPTNTEAEIDVFVDALRRLSGADPARS